MPDTDGNENLIVQKVNLLALDDQMAHFSSPDAKVVAL